jgi:hypothetical protein
VDSSRGGAQKRRGGEDGVGLHDDEADYVMRAMKMDGRERKKRAMNMGKRRVLGMERCCCTEGELYGSGVEVSEVVGGVWWCVRGEPGC